MDPPPLRRYSVTGYKGWFCKDNKRRGRAAQRGKAPAKRGYCLSASPDAPDKAPQTRFWDQCWPRHAKVNIERRLESSRAGN